MSKIFSNGPLKDFVINPFESLLNSANESFLAAPYFTEAEKILAAAKSGGSIELIVGLNSATTPNALKMIMGQPNLAVRYYTNRFHAKIYIFDGEYVLLGSSNLSDGGMRSNREAVIKLSSESESDAIEEIQALFAELWENAHVLTPEKFKQFDVSWHQHAKNAIDINSMIEANIGKALPLNIAVASLKKSSEHLFIQSLKKLVFEEYQPAFREVGKTLTEHKLHRTEFAEYGETTATNRFLNWVRLAHAPGDASWQAAKVRPQQERVAEIVRLGQEWRDTSDDKMAPHYFNKLQLVQLAFSSSERVESLSGDEIAQGLLGVHAFYEQLRFVKGGEAALPAAFWNKNFNDLTRVKKSLNYLLFGAGEFIERLHDFLYDPRFKLGYFGRYCALELAGTVRPEVCPPMNGRMAKALKFLGYDVTAS